MVQTSDSETPRRSAASMFSASRFTYLVHQEVTRSHAITVFASFAQMIAQKLRIHADVILVLRGKPDKYDGFPPTHEGMHEYPHNINTISAKT